MRATDDPLLTVLERLLREPSSEVDRLLEGLDTGSEEVRQRLDRLQQLGLLSGSVGPQLHDGSDALQLGKSVLEGQYRVLDELGRGGMGTVYRAEDTRLGREVAIKVARLSGIEDDESTRSALELLVREARITGRLEHPNIVSVHQLGLTEDGRAFLVMERVHGKTLQQMLGEAGTARRWTLGRKVQLMIQLCDALALAHSRGVVHRDLKPANVMLGAFGEVQVMDWGLGKSVPSDDPERWPAFEMPRGIGGELVGTPAFMAPEQAAGANELVDVRTDVFGLGALFHALLTERPPYAGEDVRGVLRRAAERDLSEPERLGGASVPPELRAICMKALSAEKHFRYASALEMGQDLEAWTELRSVTAWRDPFWKRSVKLVRRHPVVTAVLIGVLLVGRQGLLARRLDRQVQAQAELDAVSDLVRRLERIRESVPVTLELTGPDLRPAYALRGSYAAEREVLLPPLAARRSYVVEFGKASHVESLRSAFVSSFRDGEETPEGAAQFCESVAAAPDSEQRRLLEACYELAGASKSQQVPDLGVVLAWIDTFVQRLESSDAIQALWRTWRLTGAVTRMSTDGSSRDSGSFLVAQVLLADADSPDRLDSLLPIVHRVPENYRIQSLVASAAVAEGDAIKALEASAACRAQSPRSPAPEIVAAICWLELGRFEEALSCARRATKLDPTEAEAWRLLGLVHHRGLQSKSPHASLAQAVEAYDRSIELGSAKAAHFEWKAFLLADNDRHSEAAGVLHEARGRFPDDLDLVLQEAGVLTRIGHRAKAEALYLATIAEKPGWGIGKALLGRSFQMGSKYEQAIPYLLAAGKGTEGEQEFLGFIPQWQGGKELSNLPALLGFEPEPSWTQLRYVGTAHILRHEYLIAFYQYEELLDHLRENADLCADWFRLTAQDPWASFRFGAHAAAEVLAGNGYAFQPRVGIEWTEGALRVGELEGIGPLTYVRAADRVPLRDSGQWTQDIREHAMNRGVEWLEYALELVLKPSLAASREEQESRAVLPLDLLADPRFAPLLEHRPSHGAYATLRDYCRFAANDLKRRP